MSGVIYAVIVVMWAAFLVPMWLRRHDETAEAKSVDRFSRKMRILARRDADDTDVPGPARGFRRAARAPATVGLARLNAESSTVKIVGRGRSAADAGTTGPDLDTKIIPASARDRRAADVAEEAEHMLGVAVSRRMRLRLPLPPGRRSTRPLSLAARRRRVLTVLAGGALVLVVLAVMGRAPWWSAGLSECLVVAYVIHLRVQARRSREIARRRARLDQVEWASPRRAIETSKTVRVYDPVPARDLWVEENAPLEKVADLPADDAEVTDEGWEPVSVPVPTYVNASPAPRAVRRIDLGAGGAWTSGRLVADAATAGRAAAAAAHQADVDEASAQRAVGD